MTNTRGMTIKQFKETVEEMRTVYPFKDETAYLGDLRDIRSDELRQIDIHTTDEKTGVYIVLSKGVRANEVNN